MGIKISDLPAASGADSAMQFEVNNAGVSQRLTLAQMFALSMAAVTVDTPRRVLRAATRTSSWVND